MGNQVLYGAGNVLDRHVGIDAVLIEEVDRIHPQPLQRLLGDLADTFGPAIGRTRTAGAEIEAEFRRDNDAFLERRERFADQFLVRERSVDLGGVEESNAAPDGGADQSDHLVPIRSGAAMIVQAHATEADSRDFKAAVSKFSFLHGSRLTFQLLRKLSV